MSEQNPAGNEAPPKKPATRRPDRGPGSGMLWLLMVGFVLAVIIFSINSRSRTEVKLDYSDFFQKISAGELNSGNVHELTICEGQIRFQDQAALKTGAAPSPSAEPARVTRVDTKGMEGPSELALEELLRSKQIAYKWEQPPGRWEQYVPLLVVTTLLILMMVFLLRKIGGPGAAISFGRSRGRMYAQEELGITFADAAGIEEAVEELREIVDFLRNPAKYQALGGRIPRGVLLVGPPGTGKTLLAKAVAGEAGVPFFGLSGSDFVELFVGVGASRVRDMFAQAVQKSPAIIFIDELDALGKRRGEGGPGNHDERDQTLNALLVEMDGFSSDHSVIVMAATNRPETLDPALMRPGRFDRHVLVDRPDIRGREAILNVHVRKIKMSDDVDLKNLAKLTPGFVGADLANVVNEAALLAARKNKTKVTKAEFEEGIERVVAGLEKQTRIIPEEEKQRVAYHEIGHALVASSLPHVDPVHKVSIIPRGLGALGYTLQRPEVDRQLVTKTELQNRIAVLMGGVAAEEIVYQESSTGASNDLQRATDLARRMVVEFGMSPKLGRVHYSEGARSPFLGAMAAGVDYAHSEETIREIDLEVKRLVDQAYHTAFEVLSTQRAAVERLTRVLLEIEVMDAQMLQSILAEFKTGPQLKPGTSADADAPSAGVLLSAVVPNDASLGGAAG